MKRVKNAKSLIVLDANTKIKPPLGSAHTALTSANIVVSTPTARLRIVRGVEGGQTTMSKAIMKRSCKSVVTFLKGVINANCEEGFKWFPEVSETDVDVSAIDILYAIGVLERVDDQKNRGGDQ